MALSYVTYPGNGSTTNFSVTFGYISQADVKVLVDGVLQTLTTDYTWFNATTIQFVTAPAASTVVRLQRETQRTSRLVDFQDAGNLTEVDLDLDSDQVFYLSQEAIDNFEESALNLTAALEWDALTYPIVNVADPTNAQDAATKHYIDVTWTNYMDASVIAAQNARDAAIAAETAAGVAQTAAEAAQTATELVYDSFDDRYLGAKASAPTLDNDGNPLLTGALYFNTTTNLMYVYSSTVWLAMRAVDSIFYALGSALQVTQNTTKYAHLFDTTVTGNAAYQSSDAAMTVGIPQSGTLKNLYVKAAVNTLTTACAVTVRKNGVDTGITVSITAGSTAEFSDLVNTVSVARGDILSLSVVAPAGTAKTYIGGLTWQTTLEY